jgi:hypothetical protein
MSPDPITLMITVPLMQMHSGLFYAIPRVGRGRESTITLRFLTGEKNVHE